MKYVSIDIETTGLDPETCQILSVGAVIEDTNNILPIDELPSFHVVIKRDTIKGEPFAINMNADLIRKISENDEGDGVTMAQEEHVAVMFASFLANNGIEYNDILDKYSITVAGKNFGTFDLQFLKRLYKWDRYINVKHRIIDPAVLFVDWYLDDALPNFKECMDRSEEFEDREVSHDALQDAKDIVTLLRCEYEF